MLDPYVHIDYLGYLYWKGLFFVLLPSPNAPEQQPADHLAHARDIHIIPHLFVKFRNLALHPPGLPTALHGLQVLHQGFSLSRGDGFPQQLQPANHFINDPEVFSGFSWQAAISASGVSKKSNGLETWA